MAPPDQSSAQPPDPDPPQGRGRREPLTRRRVLEAALALVDREGGAALSMRRLAGELRVAPMSIYNHVSGRDDLLTGLSEVMVQRIGMRFGEEPATALARLAHGIRAVARAHPAAFELVGMRPLRTPDGLLPVEAGLGALRGLGLPDDDAVAAYRVLVGFARGFALGEIATVTLDSAEDRGLRATGLDPDRFPHIIELAPAFAASDGDRAFALGVEILVAGLAARAPG